MRISLRHPIDREIKLKIVVNIPCEKIFICYVKIVKTFLNKLEIRNWNFLFAILRDYFSGVDPDPVGYGAFCQVGYVSEKLAPDLDPNSEPDLTLRTRKGKWIVLQGLQNEINWGEDNTTHGKRSHTRFSKMQWVSTIRIHNFTSSTFYPF